MIGWESYSNKPYFVTSNKLLFKLCMLILMVVSALRTCRCFPGWSIDPPSKSQTCYITFSVIFLHGVKVCVWCTPPDLTIMPSSQLFLFPVEITASIQQVLGDFISLFNLCSKSKGVQTFSWLQKWCIIVMLLFCCKLETQDKTHSRRQMNVITLQRISGEAYIQFRFFPYTTAFLKVKKAHNIYFNLCPDLGFVIIGNVFNY